jgi:hypothetical protein
MTRLVATVADDTTRALRGLARIAQGAVALALPVIVVAGIVFMRAGGISAASDRVTGPIVEVAPDASAPARLDAAATAIEAALGKEGGGITFEIVQTQTIKARPDGPQLEIPDPKDPTKSLGWTDTEFVGTLIERGLATPKGFWSELIHGPEAGTAFELAKASPPAGRWCATTCATATTAMAGTKRACCRASARSGDGGQAARPVARRTDVSEVAVEAETDAAFALPGLEVPAQEPLARSRRRAMSPTCAGAVAADLAPATELWSQPSSGSTRLVAWSPSRSSLGT